MVATGPADMTRTAANTTTEPCAGAGCAQLHRPEQASGSGTTRRAFFAGAGAGAAALVLAACGSSGGGSNDSGDDGGQGGSGEVPSGTVLVKTSKVPVKGAVAVTVSGQKILVTQPASGTFKAFSAVCTHAGCTVAPAKGELDCPCHGSRFDLSTAKVLGGPAPSPLPEIAVSVSGDQVVSA